MYQLSQTQSLGLPRGKHLQLPILIEVQIRRLKSCLRERTFQHGTPEIRDHAKVMQRPRQGDGDMSTLM
jgi:hypothetical protein